jgi:hypothetical protein
VNLANGPSFRNSATIIRLCLISGVVLAGLDGLDTDPRCVASVACGHSTKKGQHEAFWADFSTTLDDFGSQLAALGPCAWEAQCKWQRFVSSATFDRYVLWDSVPWSACSQASWTSLRLFVTSKAKPKAWVCFHFLDADKVSGILTDDGQVLRCIGMGIKRVRKAPGSVSEFGCEICQ